MNALLALAAGALLYPQDADMRLSYSQLGELFPDSISFEEQQNMNDGFIQTDYLPFRRHFFSTYINSVYGGISLSYSIAAGKFGNLIAGEFFNLAMISGSIESEHARLQLEYSLSTSEFHGNFLEGLFTVKNVLGFAAEFPVYGFTPGVYANVRSRHLLSAGRDDINLRAGAHAGYSFFEYFSVSAFYEHEWIPGSNDIARAGLGFAFSY